MKHIVIFVLIGLAACRKSFLIIPPIIVPRTDTINKIQLYRYYDGQAGINYLKELEFDSLSIGENGSSSDTIIKAWNIGTPGPADAFTYTVCFQYLGSVPLLNIDSIKSDKNYKYYYAPDKRLLNKPIFRAYQFNGRDTTVINTYVLAGGGEIDISSVEYLTPHANDSLLTIAYNTYLSPACLATVPWLLHLR